MASGYAGDSATIEYYADLVRRRLKLAALQHPHSWEIDQARRRFENWDPQHRG